MKAIWKGSIGFGLVNIPVNMYSAVQNSELDLDLVDKKDHGKIHFKRVNENTGREVSWDNIAHAYDYNGKYILLSDKDFESVSPAKSKTIDIVNFVNASEVDSIYYETPYYLEPTKAGTKAYALLREALQKTGKIGVGSFVLRNKEHLVVLKADNNAIILNRMRFAEEIRDIKSLNIPAAKGYKPQEVKMAVTLINQMSSAFNIKKYKDTYTAGLLKIIKAKAKGKKTTIPKLRVAHREKGDLMEQLKASLQKKKKAS